MGYFNFFDEWAMDPKVQAIPEQFRSRHVALLCLRNIGETADLSDNEIAVFMRITIAEARKTKEVFRRQGFIDGDGWNVRRWEQRQNGQSESLQRVRKHRAMKASRNVTVTLQSNAKTDDVTLHETLPRVRPGARDVLPTLLTNDTNNLPPYPPGENGAGGFSASLENPETEVRRLEAIAEMRWPGQEATPHVRDLCREFDYRLVREIMDQDHAASAKKFRPKWERSACTNEMARGWKPPAKEAAPAEPVMISDEDKRKAIERGEQQLAETIRKRQERERRAKNP